MKFKDLVSYAGVVLVILAVVGSIAFGIYMDHTRSAAFNACVKEYVTGGRAVADAEVLCR